MLPRCALLVCIPPLPKLLSCASLLQAPDPDVLPVDEQATVARSTLPGPNHVVPWHRDRTPAALGCCQPLWSSPRRGRPAAQLTVNISLRVCLTVLDCVGDCASQWSPAGIRMPTPIRRGGTPLTSPAGRDRPVLRRRLSPNQEQPGSPPAPHARRDRPMGGRGRAGGGLGCQQNGPQCPRARRRANRGDARIGRLWQAVPSETAKPGNQCLPRPCRGPRLPAVPEIAREDRPAPEPQRATGGPATRP